VTCNNFFNADTLCGRGKGVSCIKYFQWILGHNFVFSLHTLKPKKTFKNVWPLTPWPWTFALDRVSPTQTLYQIGAKLNNLRLGYEWFSKFFQKGWIFKFSPWEGVNQTEPNLEECRAPSSLHQPSYFSIDMLLISKWGRLKDEWCRRSRPNFTSCKFWPVNFGGEVGKNDQWDDLVDTTAKPVIYIWRAAPVQSRSLDAP